MEEKNREQLNELINEKRSLQRMYRHACDRAWELRTRVVPPEKEAKRREFLTRVKIEKRDLCREINDLSEQIWRMERKMQNEKQ